ncbi:MAG: FecR domain-containing protein [Synechococcus sp.]
MGLVGIALAILPPQSAIASPEPSPLTSATVDRIVNLVTVELQQTPPQTARVDDVLVPDDRLHTGSTSLAQMVFNDASLVRVGQNSSFIFSPESRKFNLQEGVMMMVTPPGAGGAEIVTPTAIAGVQGSLLTVTARTRDDGKPTTLISTFTSPAEIRNLDNELLAELAPRQMALVVDGDIVAIANFNACETVSSSPILQGLAKEHDLSSESAEAAQTLQMERDILHDQVTCNGAPVRTVERPEIDIYVPQPSPPEPQQPTDVIPELPIAERPPIEVDVDIPEPELPDVDIPDVNRPRSTPTVTDPFRGRSPNNNE